MIHESVYVSKEPLRRVWASEDVQSAKEEGSFGKNKLLTSVDFHDVRIPPTEFIVLMDSH